MKSARRLLVIGGEPLSLLIFRMPLLLQAQKDGFEVHAAATKAPPDVVRELRAANVEFHEIFLARAGISPLGDLRSLVSIYRVLRLVRPQGVICYTSKLVIYGILAAWLARIPKRAALITGLGYSFIDGKEPKRRIAKFATLWLYRISLPYATAIIFQNPDDKLEFETMGILNQSERISVVNGSGVDLSQFQQVELPNHPSFLMIGRLVADKGVREYAAAAIEVKKQIPESEFTLLGPLDVSHGSISQGEVDFWTEQGLQCHGYAKDVRPWIAKANVVVLPSYREGTPRSVLEGMAMGRAIITTDVPGCRETVRHGENGLLVAPRSVEQLVSAMRELAENPERVTMMGRKSRLFAELKYEANSVARDTLSKAGMLDKNT